MNYYEHHIGDYAEATMHLTFLEDAAYSRLLRKYYATETPLPADVKAVQRLVGARSKAEKDAVVTVLEEFFHLEGDGWHNDRCDEEIDAYRKGEPERELKKANENNRMARHREERARLFQIITASGEHASWNTPMAELRTLAQRINNVQVTATATPATEPATGTVTPPATATATPATATHTPDTIHQTPIDIKEGISYLQSESADSDANPATPETLNSPSGDAPATPSRNGLPDCPHGKILALYAKHLPQLTQHRSWEGARRDKLRCRWQQAAKPSTYSPEGYTTEQGGLQWWDDFLGYIAAETRLASGFPRDDGSTWQPDLDWICTPANFQKIIDGKYDK